MCFCSLLFITYFADSVRVHFTEKVGILIEHSTDWLHNQTHLELKIQINIYQSNRLFCIKPNTLITISLKSSGNYIQKIVFNVEMSQTSVKALDYQVEEVGKHVKSTKKRYTWKFSIGQNTNTLICDSSIVSSKIKLTYNGKTVIASDLSSSVLFQYSFSTQGCSLTVLQQASDFQLRINNRSFIHMLTQQRTTKCFKNQDQHPEDIIVSQNITKERDGKMITLNMGLVGDGMKKKRNQTQSEKWKEMGANGIQYFKKLQEEQRGQMIVTPQNKLKQGNHNAVQKQFEPSPALNKLQKTDNAINLMEDFNTMQQMFATNACSMPILNCNQNKQNNGQQFSTMQQLFATKAPQLPQKQQFSTIQQLFQTAKAPLASQQAVKQENKGQDLTNAQFNTIQNLFKTLTVQQIGKIPTNIDPKDFSTMQQLFQTRPNILADKKQIQTADQKIPDSNDFSTMMNLFKTISPPQPSVSEADNKSNPQEFSTIQQLFATNNFQIPTNIQLKDQQNMNPNIQASDFSTLSNLFKTLQQPVKSEKPQFVSREVNNNLQQVKNIQKINMNDFNTMQNLFKTNNLNDQFNIQ